MHPTAANSAARSQHSDLVRGLGLWSAIAIVIGDTIGTGIFLVSQRHGSRRRLGYTWFLPPGSSAV